jgi:hypothetical protein
VYLSILVFTGVHLFPENRVHKPREDRKGGHPRIPTWIPTPIQKKIGELATWGKRGNTAGDDIVRGSEEEEDDAESVGRND